MSTEEQILSRLMIDGALAALRPADQAIIELLYAYRPQPGYRGVWPPTAEEIGEYVGATFPEFRGRAVTARTVWRRHAAVLERWAREREGGEQARGELRGAA